MRQKLIVLSIVFVLIFVGLAIRQFVIASRFSEQLWKSSSVAKTGYDTGNPRKHMVNDLRARILTSGMSRESVLSILGPPDDDRSATSNEILYYIGGDSRLKFWKILPVNEYILLDFDSQEKLDKSQFWIEK
jgi:hypothetical protein